MTKKVSFKMPIAKAKAVDTWVDAGSGPERPKAGPTKRFTLDVPAELHRRIKVECAARGLNMADVLRDVLEREFPVKS